MAQKTPLTALTIDYADRWNGTWFVELSIFRYKLIEDYHLRFLITCFLRIKKQWLYLLSVNHSGGFLFLQMMTCYSNAKVQTKPMLFPTQEGQASLKDWQQQFEKKVNKLTIFQKLNLDPWQKRLSVKKQNMWNYLQNTLLLQTNDNLAAGIFFSRMPQHATLSTWFHNKQVKLTLILLAEHINNALIMAQYNNNSLLAVIQQNFIMKINIIKDKMKYLQNLDWLLFLPMLHNIKKSNVTQRQFKKVLVQKRLFSSQQLFSLVKLSNNYPLQIYSSHINVQLKEFQVTTQQQLSVKKVSVSSYKKKELTAYYFSRKKALYQTIYQSKSYLMRRIFAFKQYSSMKEGFQVFFKRFRLQFALRKTLIMLNTPLIFLAQALKRVTGLRQFFSYLPMKWSHYDYKPVKRYTIFERYGTKKYFVPTFVATHLAMSRGSATVLVDLLVHKLRHEYAHTQFLACVEKICRHLMAPPKSNTAYENVICKGIEILFTGKVNGSDRSKQWRFKLGPVHSSTFYTNTRLEQAKVITKFGSFNLSVRMKLGGLGTRYYSILILLGNLENVLFSFIILNLTTIYIFLAKICMAFLVKNHIKSDVSLLVKMLPTSLKSALLPITLWGVVDSFSVLVNKKELIPLPEDNTKNTGIVVKVYSAKRVNRSNFPKYYRTSSYKKYYSTSFLKQKLKNKLNEINISFSNNKKKYFLFIIIFCQIIFFFYFLKYWAFIFFSEWEDSFYAHNHDIFLVFKDALMWCGMFVSMSQYNLWHVFVGLFFARSFYFAFIGIGFFYRNIFGFLLDSDNFWLKKFIDKHFLSNDIWLFLNKINWFNALSLMDQALIRIILIKLWSYLNPFIFNLLFLRYLGGEFFLIGIFITLFCQFLCFLFICYSYLVYLCANKTNDKYLSTKISQNYKNNCDQQFYILLFLNVTYNFILVIVWLVLHFFATAFWLKFLSVIYISLFYFLTILFILYSTAVVLANSFYFILLLIFKINFDNLDELDLFLKKRELLLHVCFSLCAAFFYYITFMNFLMYQLYDYSLDNVKKKYTKVMLLKNYSELRVKNNFYLSKYYSTLAGSKRYYSNFSFKEKLEKALKVIKHKQKNLYISAIMLSQIFLFLYFLQKFIHIYFMNWIFFFAIDYTLDEVLLISLFKFRDRLYENPYFLWNFTIGLSSARCFYAAVEGILFFYRKKFNPFVLDPDNLWLSRFIKRHKFLKEQWRFLNRFNKFNSLTLLDQDLIRIILIKLWFYLFPFVVNLLFLKTLYWPWFLMGLSAMWFFQFFIFLVSSFCMSVYFLFIKVYNKCFLEKFAKNYENNFLQYTNIFLTQNLVYNFFLITFLIIVFFFKEKFWLDNLAVIAVFLLVAFIVIGFLVSLAGTFFGFLYFFTLLVFNTHLQNLTEYELFIKKSKVFLHICVLLFFILLFLYYKP